MEDFIKKRDREPLDIDEIVKDIRKEIEEKKEMGLLLEEEIQKIKELEFENIFLSLSSHPDTNTPYEKLEDIKDFLLKPKMNLHQLKDLYDEVNGWNIDENYPIISHRKGLKGYIIRLLKKAFRPIIKLYTDAIFYKQKLINYYFMNIIAISFRIFFDLKNTENYMISKLDSFERDINFIRERQKILEEYLEEIEEKISKK